MGKNDVQINYTPTPTLAKFHASDKFYRAVRGPFGSGKSTACCMEIMRRATEMPAGPDGKRKSRWAVVRNTYRELSDTTQKTWFDWFPESHFGIFRKNTATHHVRFNDVELDIIFRALDEPDDIKKLLSLELTGAWVNEAREIPKAIIDALAGRVGRYPPRRDVDDYFAGIILDSNPPDTDHWWAKLDTEPETIWDHRTGVPVHDFLRGIDDLWGFFSQPSGLSKQAENLENLPIGYYERLAAGKSAEWIKVYVHGQYGFIVDGRPVFSEYVDTVHCSDHSEPIPGIEIIRGWDFGLTPSCVFFQLTPRGQIIVFDELVSQDMGIDTFGEDVIGHSYQHYNNFKFRDFGDPAGQQRAQTDEKTCFQLLFNKGIEIEAGKQDLTIRLESVRKALSGMRDGQPTFQLHPRCRMLRKGFMGAYQFRKVAGSSRRDQGLERMHEKPDKNLYSHPMDALQYGLSRVIGTKMINPDWDYYEEKKEQSRRFDYRDYRGRSAITGY